MRITLAQLGSTLGDLDANLARAAEVVAQAGGEGADLVIFPELFLTGYDFARIEQDVEIPSNDPRLLALSTVSPGTDVSVGYCEDGLGIHNYNASGYYDAGARVYNHRKLYLPTYDTFEERKHFNVGQSMRAYDTRHGRIATLICNDAWQPHLAFLAVQDGARVLLVPTNSATSRRPDLYHSGTYWRDITVFYARMYQCYVVFCNRVGDESEILHFWGGSHIVDPWGKVICELPFDEEAVHTEEIDLALVRARRRALPLVREARLDLIAREARRIADEGGDA